jgi:DNA-binding CsgD family transcriptional regulator
MGVLSESGTFGKGELMSEDGTERDPKIQLLLAGVFLVLVVGGIIDLILDRPDSLFSVHVLFELALIAVSLASATYLARGWYSASHVVTELKHSLADREAERDAWKARAALAMESLGSAVSLQLTDWKLTRSERETSVFLLKGYSSKKIARLTGRSDRTVRQHAVSVYRKSGLEGRAELAAFFLGDLTVPPE